MTDSELDAALDKARADVSAGKAGAVQRAADLEAFAAARTAPAAPVAEAKPEPVESKPVKKVAAKKASARKS